MEMEAAALKSKYKLNGKLLCLVQYGRIASKGTVYSSVITGEGKGERQ